jgi:hypothetical protein
VPYIAFHRDEYIVCLPTLAEVLAIIAELSSPGDTDEVAVWHGQRVVCVVHVDGRITWLQPQYKEAAAQAA